MGFSEERTRVTCFLPLGATPSESQAAFNAAQDVMGSLGNPVTGFTHSSLRPAVFTGNWWSEERQRWVPERVAELVIDYLTTLDGKDIDGIIGELEQRIRCMYKQRGYEQALIWIVAERVIRYN
jgi:hypothetical protein